MTAHDSPSTPESGPARSISSFTHELFGHLPRADQRRWAQAYLQGLLTTGGKKSVRRLAASVSASPTAFQSLQQFINASPWDWAPARQELMRWVEERAVPRAWLIGLAVMPKRGDRSVGVHRRFVHAAGRTINCQVGIGGFLSTASGDFPVDWQLLLPGQWCQDEDLRQRTRIPDGARRRHAWAYVLDLVQSVAARTAHAAVPVVADMTELSEAGALVNGLGRAGHGFVLAVPGSLRVVPATKLPTALGRAGQEAQRPLTAQRFLHLVGWQHPHIAPAGTSGGGHHVRIHSAVARLPTPDRHDQSYRLFTEGRPGKQTPGRIWITNLMNLRVDELLALTRLETRTAATLRTLAEDFGLLDFEGRSFPGWHHHMTLVSAAYAYRLLAETDGDPYGTLLGERIA
ncbi:transposase [Streptomyces sp. TRM S81-3]|uniref:Transposase n=1 Tax=Streptomyces griseicoloratus TaxID=2752516 RepID=A0A926L5F2_9ACTN|nr:transposase [Streptomyces griseicoloratus]MBD0420438.1 transposase [Streptomyces griseicoloratus]